MAKIDTIPEHKKMPRLAMTAIGALDRLGPERHPMLRSAEALWAFDRYDAAMERCITLSTAAFEEGVQRDPSWGPRVMYVNARLLDSTKAVLGYAEHIENIPGMKVDDLPGYLNTASAVIEAALDELDAAVDYDYAAHREVVARPVEEIGSLKDTVQHLLDTARRKRKHFAETYTIPQEFRSLLRTDAAMKEIARIFPPLSASKKRALARAFDEGAWDVYLDPKQKLGSKEIATAYRRALASARNNLENGVLRGGGIGKADLKVAKNVHGSMTVIGASDENQWGKWTLQVRFASGRAVLEYRFSMTSKGVAKVLKAWIKKAMAEMEAVQEDPIAQRDYAVGRFDDLLRGANDRILRSWQRGSVSTSVSLDPEDPANASIKVELLHTTERSLSSDSTTRDRQLLDMHARRRQSIGNRSAAEKKAQRIISKLGGSLTGAQEIRERSDDLHTGGFRLYLSVPLSVKPERLTKALCDIAWTVGRGQRQQDPEDVQRMQAFEKQYGVSKTRLQSAKVKKAQLQRKLAGRIDKVLGNSSLVLSRGIRNELGKLKKALDTAIVTDINKLVFTWPNRLDQIEEDFVRKASVGNRGGRVIDPLRLHGHLSRHMPRRLSAALRASVKRHGIDVSSMPTADALVDLIVAQAKQDAEHYGVNGSEFVLRVKHGDYTDHHPRLGAVMANDGTEMVFSNEGDHLVIRASLPSDVRDSVAA